MELRTYLDLCISEAASSEGTLFCLCSDSDSNLDSLIIWNHWDGNWMIPQHFFENSQWNECTSQVRVKIPTSTQEVFKWSVGFQERRKEPFHFNLRRLPIWICTDSTSASRKKSPLGQEHGWLSGKMKGILQKKRLVLEGEDETK